MSKRRDQADQEPLLNDGNLGKRLKALRSAKGYSLADVAKGTDISRSFLSLVETGRSDITLRRLLRLIEFYEISLAELLPDLDFEGRTVVRHEERRHVKSPGEGLDVFYLSLDTSRTMMPMLFHITPGGSTLERARHEGEEFVYVIQGQLTIDVEGAEPLVLEQGDSAYFPGNHPHAYSNAGGEEVQYLAVVTPPSLHVY